MGGQWPDIPGHPLGGYGLERVFGHTIPSSQHRDRRRRRRTRQRPEKHDWSMLMNASLRPQSTDDFCLLINGKLVPGAATMNVINPATEEIVAACPRADLNQLNEAVAAAKAAFATWKNVPIEKRRQLVLKLADGLESRTAEIAQLLTQEQGKPLGFAMWEVGEACRIIRTFAAMELKDEVLRDTPEVKIVRQRAPLGVAHRRRAVRNVPWPPPGPRPGRR